MYVVEDFDRPNEVTKDTLNTRSEMNHHTSLMKMMFDEVVSGFDENTLHEQISKDPLDVFVAVQWHPHRRLQHYA